MTYTLTQDRDSTPPVVHQADKNTIRVLLVEDNPSDAYLVRALLEVAQRPSVVLTEAECLGDGLEALRRERFDVILLDLFLPDARKLDAVKRVRAETTTPIVVLTARDDEHLAIEAVQTGAQDYLLKPRINPESLLRSLRYATERHGREQAEKALQHGEEYFRALLENGSDIVTVAEADGTVRYASPATERVLGYRPAERVGKSAFDIIHPDDLPAVISAFQQGTQTAGLTRTMEYRVRHKDGSWRMLLSTGCNLLGNPAIHGVVVTSRDITERAQADREREHHVSLLRATLEATADGILVADEGRRVVSYNEQFCRMWRIPESLLGEEDGDLLSFVLDQIRDPETFLKRVGELYGDREAEAFDVIELSDGRVFERFTKPQKIGGKTVGRVWSFRDVTERLQLEEQFRQSQRMDAVGQLAGGIAHDFNSSLTVIKGTVALLLMELPEESHIREDLAEIEHCADRAANLTHQLLAFSRKQILQPEVLDLNEVARRMESVLRRTIGEHIEFVTRLDPALGRTRVDPGQIEQVIANLALNARDAMPGGGMLTLSTRNVGPEHAGAGNCSAGGTPGCVQLVVSDTGAGMDEMERSRLFEPFFTRKGKGQGEGCGLGLAAVHGIVQQSGGDIRVESAPFEGTTFTICFPRAAEEPPAPRRQPTPGVPGTGTVLLAEDEPSVRKIARRILERGGCHVLAAGNAAEAMRLAGSHDGPIHLLLTDTIMPGGSGPELAVMLSELHPQTKVIFMSGYTEDVLAPSGVLDAETVFLQKPFEPAQLMGLVSEQLAAARAEAHV